MKVAVVTPYDSSNFGAFLQAFCLKMALEKMGYTVIHIKNRDIEQARKLYYHEKPIGKKERLMPWKFAGDKAFGQKKFKIFDYEQSFFDVREMNDCSADVYILGSDEIWNINHSVFRDTHFWGSGMIPAISYAASIGNADKDKFHDYPAIINCLNNLSTALVRDQRTLDMVNSYSNIEAEMVCDPTMLVSIDDYGEEYYDSYFEKHECLLVYAYTAIKENEKQAILNTAKKLNLKTVACCFRHSWCDYQVQCSPLQFSDLIRKSKAIVTTTFHGTIFCLLNHANFVSITASVKTNQLLSLCGVESRGITREKVCDKALLEQLEIPLYNIAKLDDIIYKTREKSLALLDTAIKKAVQTTNNFDYQICSFDDCTGCLACMNICSKTAISCTIDYQGRTLPLIDATKCVHCGACKKVCPTNFTVVEKYPQTCFAAQIPDVEKRKKSASGGIGAILSEHYIEKGGVVYGAAVQRDCSLIHVRASTIEDVDRFRCSKYVQSYVGYAYREVKTDLDNGREVLFTGTPCQIAGLKNYLGQLKQYKNLLCVDIICHGVPPFEYLRQHINSISNDGNINNYTFRGGDSDFHLVLYKDKEIEYDKDKDHDEYYFAFLKSYIYRKNCYRCKYAQTERVSDMTIGDFWGIDRDSISLVMRGRISTILINTKQGEKAFNEVKGNLCYLERPIQEAIDGNPQLRHPSMQNNVYLRFIRSYSNGNAFNRAIKESGIKRQITINDLKRNKIYVSLRNVKKTFVQKEKR
ncbi:Coenzyme F420 hydrogenase/dehydrogenase, beta subunit C-terminal domain [Acetobacterium wieringae]|uniref:Coenzyme F420 hydrogenase/dehydrogenase, beta subunit C-terminal domain n=1 Tax=Acetobacterium wieringae TaxID=52694 RepID=UPI0026F31ED7|nr:Coenzyme F420 hydrogenase/dehydrogenase, beta subunit C-terminal domain [Acetobacterium wieringae]